MGYFAAYGVGSEEQASGLSRALPAIRARTLPSVLAIGGDGIDLVGVAFLDPLHQILQRIPTHRESSATPRTRDRKHIILTVEVGEPLFAEHPKERGQLLR